jgi:Tfp pilus assembly PilM family ATPase
LIGKWFSKDEDFVCIDIGSFSIKIINVEKIKEAYVVKNSFVVSNIYNFEDDDSYSIFMNDISNLLKENEVTTKKIIIVPSEGMIVEQVVKLENYNEKDLVNLIEGEYIKNFNQLKDFGSYRFDYELLGKISSKGRISDYYLISGIHNIVAEKLLQTAKLKGFYLDRVSTEISSVNNLIKIKEKEFNGVHLHIGNKGTGIFLIKDNSVIFTRKLNFGMEHLVKNLHKELDLPKEVLIKNLKENGMLRENLPELLENAGYSENLNALLSSFLNELYDTLNYIKGTYGFTINNITLSGGFSNAVGLKKIISEYVNIRLEFLLEKFDTDKLVIEETGMLNNDNLIALGLGIWEGKDEKTKFIALR